MSPVPIRLTCEGRFGKTENGTKRLNRTDYIIFFKECCFYTLGIYLSFNMIINCPG